jgi:hypothetical protein
MKSPNNSFFKLLAAALFVLLMGGQQVQAQKYFEGSISYAIRLSGKVALELMTNDPANIMDMHIKDDNFIVHLSGGRIPRTFLFIGDSNHTYVVDAATRRAYRRTYYIEDTTVAAPVAEPTGEKVSIKGYVCDEYKVERPKDETITYYYVNDAVRINLDLYAGMDKARADFLTEGLDGRIPLRKIIKSPGLTTEIDMRSLKAKDLDKENFLIPASFKLKNRDPRK